MLFYKLGSYVLILFAVIHTSALFGDPAKLLTDEESKKIWQLIHSHQFHIEGMSFTVRSLLMGFSLYLEIFSLGLGVLNLVAAKYQADNKAFLKTMAIVNLLILGLLLVVTAIYFHLPPLILFGLAWLFFLISFIMVKKV